VAQLVEALMISLLRINWKWWWQWW